MFRIDNYLNTRNHYGYMGEVIKEGSCKKQILDQLNIAEELTAYDLKKILGYNYSTMNRYCRELYFQGLIKSRREVSTTKIKVFYSKVEKIE